MARTVTERADAVPHLAEAFREHGYHGASLDRLGAATGLGRGSLYHFFPGGKAEMATAVLADITSWFDVNVFTPLRTAEPVVGVAAHLDAVESYFRSGRRICLVGALATTDARDRFSAQIDGYFTAWIDALAGALDRQQYPPTDARHLAEDTVAAIQGALVLAHATGAPEVFSRTIADHRARLTGRDRGTSSGGDPAAPHG